METDIKDLMASILCELSIYRYYQALDHYLRALGEDSCTALATRILVKMDSHSLRFRLLLLLILDRIEKM